MKKPIPSLIAISTLAVGLSLSSCVDPYAYGTTSTTVTTYSPGHTTRSLPRGYRTEVIGGTNYYYHNGAYYRSRSGQYVVVDAPRSSRYYDDYRSHRNHDHRDNDRNRDRGRDRDRDHRDGRGAEVRTITRLPDGSRPIQVRGSTYYQHRDQYYRRQGNAYIGVAKPF